MKARRFSAILILLSALAVCSSFTARADAPVFNKDLFYGIRGDVDVTRLQQFLTAQKVYSGPITGNFFSLTLAGVKKFQVEQGIIPTAGYFGPRTRAKANAIVSLQSAVSVPAPPVVITPIQTPISTPPPLRALGPVATPATSSFALTPSGIFSNTNIQRGVNGGLPALSENATLDGVARARLLDMFQKQYFAHVAPDGASAPTVAKAAGYNYLSLGENLALGNFAGDQGVVTAWMNSPGHRANILGSHYTQIGIAASEGIFQGEDTWLAVQIFGRPASDCPAPDANLKTIIDNAEIQLAQMQTQIQATRAELDALVPQSGAPYDQKVVDYNALVDLYNALLGQTKPQIATYNSTVEAFNLCIQS
jgi:uncharacterized protein YkwD